MALKDRFISKHAHLALLAVPSSPSFVTNIDLICVVRPRTTCPCSDAHTSLQHPGREIKAGRQAGIRDRFTRSRSSITAEKATEKKSLSLLLSRVEAFPAPRAPSYRRCARCSPAGSSDTKKAKSSRAADAVSPSHFSPAPRSTDLAPTIMN